MHCITIPKNFLELLELDEKEINLMCCFFTTLLLFGPRLAILIWWIYTPVYINTLFQSWVWPILGWFFLPWTTLMYMTVAGGGIVGFDWIIVGMGVFADMASYFGSYAERRRLPYGDRIPTY